MFELNMDSTDEFCIDKRFVRYDMSRFLKLEDIKIKSLKLPDPKNDAAQR